MNDHTMLDVKFKSLNLEDKNFTDLSFLEKLLAHYPSFKSIDLSNNPIGNAGCTSLAKDLRAFP